MAEEDRAVGLSKQQRQEFGRADPAPPAVLGRPSSVTDVPETAFSL
ncbi:hypothetical protein INP57_28065 [Saccharopolyspora sp. HNM0986]|nr:hypothetical protein [Saccharopolyspora sp. HNM0986]MBK0870669.1 hypothetical protein [Saccharopolyspora sp. HNM0986]